VVLRVNNVYGIFRAVESGLGIASLPDYLARESTKIETVLPDLNVRTTDVYFTYPEELRHSKRIAVFRDFLLRKVAETRF
jgi:DNA-binding transcriptional LysR family regulator